MAKKQDKVKIILAPTAAEFLAAKNIQKWTYFIMGMAIAAPIPVAMAFSVQAVPIRSTHPRKGFPSCIPPTTMEFHRGSNLLVGKMF